MAKQALPGAACGSEAAAGSFGRGNQACGVEAAESG